MSAILLCLSGFLIAGEKGGNTVDTEEEIQILKDFETFEHCPTPTDDDIDDTVTNLCEKLNNDPEISYSTVNGISADREFETRRKFFTNCCY